MIGKKKKLAKKEYQEDKLVTSFYKTQELFEEHKQTFIIVLSILAVIILAITWYFNKRSEDNLLAAAQLSQITPIFEQGQYQKAIDGEPGTQLIGLEEIVEIYGGTEQGEIAKIYLANSYYALNDVDEALKYFSDYSGDSKLHLATSYAGMAACYEDKSNFDKAAELYEKAANTYLLDSQTADFLLNAGINYMKVGKNDHAKSLLEKVKSEFNSTTAAREVEKYLSQI